MGHLMFTLLGCIGFGSFLGSSEHTALVGHLLLQLLQLLLCDHPFCQGFVMPTQQCSHLHMSIYQNAAQQIPEMQSIMLQ